MNLWKTKLKTIPLIISTKKIKYLGENLNYKILMSPSQVAQLVGASCTPKGYRFDPRLERIWGGNQLMFLSYSNVSLSPFLFL